MDIQGLWFGYEQLSAFIDASIFWLIVAALPMHPAFVYSDRDDGPAPGPTRPEPHLS